MGAYCITKHGLEAFSDVLRLEMKQFNVKVSMIEPGNYLSATNSTSCKEDLVHMARHMWDQLDESLQKDYERESLERQIRIGEILLSLSVSYHTSCTLCTLNNTCLHIHKILSYCFNNCVENLTEKRQLLCCQRHDGCPIPTTPEKPLFGRLYV